MASSSLSEDSDDQNIPTSKKKQQDTNPPNFHFMSYYL